MTSLSFNKIDWNSNGKQVDKFEVNDLLKWLTDSIVSNLVRITILEPVHNVIELKCIDAIQLQRDATSLATNLSKQKKNVTPSKTHSLALGNRGFIWNFNQTARLFGQGIGKFPYGT